MQPRQPLGCLYMQPILVRKIRPFLCGLTFFPQLLFVPFLTRCLDSRVCHVYGEEQLQLFAALFRAAMREMP